MSETDPTTPTTATPQVPVTTEEKTFSLDYVKELRTENAGLRVGNREAVEAAKAEVTAEWEAKLAAKDVELSNLQSESLGKDVTLSKLRAAIDLGVPSDKLVAFSEVIKGDTEEDIKASAQSAKELFAVKTNDPAFDPTQGSGGRAPLALNGDPLMQMVRTIVGA